MMTPQGRASTPAELFDALLVDLVASHPPMTKAQEAELKDVLFRLLAIRSSDVDAEAVTPK
jgi:hypothetical protein